MIYDIQISAANYLLPTHTEKTDTIEGKTMHLFVRGQKLETKK